MKARLTSADPSRNKKIEQLKLVVIFGLIFAASYLLFRAGDDSTLPGFLRWYMGVFILVFVAIKLVNYAKFVMMFSVYDIIARRFKLYAYIYPFILLGLAGLYLVDIAPFFRNLATLTIALIASVGVFQDVFLRKNKFSCGILGNIIRLPFTTVSLIEDAALAGMAAVTLILL